jgi:hypothetical protein
MLTATESNTAPECLCGVLLREDRDACPVHGTKAQEAKAREAQAPRKVSVGRTQPLWEEPSESTAVDEIWLMVERMYFDGRITWRQRGLFQWAARKSREVESPARCSRCAQSIDGVEEL